MHISFWIVEYKLPHYFNPLFDWYDSCVRGLECGGMNNNGPPETQFFSALKIKSMEFFHAVSKDARGCRQRSIATSIWTFKQVNSH